MKIVLIAWELGGGLGHVMRAAAFAREFSSHGIRSVVCLRNLADITSTSWPDDVIILQSPIASKTPKGLGCLASYAEILYACGYHDGNQLSALITSWSHLLELVSPDLVIADHAPTALLAAQIADIPSTRIGTGFFAPPPVSPMPQFRNWQDIDELRIKTVEDRVLQIVNAIMSACGMPKFPSLSVALTPNLELIASWPELDCYAALRPQGSAQYIGNERIHIHGASPQWPRSALSGRKKVVAYLKGDYSAIEAVLGALRDQCATIAYVANFDDKARRRFSTEDLWLSANPIDLAKASMECDCLISHAGAGTPAIFLEAGKPALLLPYQAEQKTNADLIERTGAGLSLDENQVQNSFACHLAHFISNPDYIRAAEILASRWANTENAVASGTAEILRWFQAPDFTKQ